MPIRNPEERKVQNAAQLNEFKMVCLFDRPLEQKKPFKSLPLATGSENRSFADWWQFNVGAIDGC
jgi:hypothetical protein